MWADKFAFRWVFWLEYSPQTVPHCRNSAKNPFLPFAEEKHLWDCGNADDSVKDQKNWEVFIKKKKKGLGKKKFIMIAGKKLRITG